MLHPKLLGKLVELRKILERPVYINSGYRCLKYNQKVGGIKNSYHWDRVLREEEFFASGCAAYQT
jgi:uncharacterized protein YcbK (DUF882 family)